MERIRLLLVDDEADFRIELAGTLRRMGFEVRDVENGFRAIEEVRAKDIDVVILGIGRAGMDGYETLKAIKSIDSTVEVIVLTGPAQSESGREGMRLGAFDYVAKPCDIDALVLRIGAAFQKREGQADRSDAASARGSS